MSAPTRPRITHDHPPGRSVRTRLAGALFLLALGMALAAVLGPLVTGVIRHHVSEASANQIRGGDVAVLALAVPMSIVAGVLLWRGRAVGPILALGPAVFAMYMYSQLALGGDTFRYPGNSERFFPLYLGIFLLSGGIALVAWRMIDGPSLPAFSKRVRRVFGWFALVVVSFLVFGLHLPGLLDAWSEQPMGPEYIADPVVFWLVKFMDLGIVVPTVTAVAIATLRRNGPMAKATYAVVGWIALLGSSVAGMAIVMWVTDDPAATVANAIAFVVFAIVALAVAIAVVRPVWAMEAHGGDQGPQ